VANVREAGESVAPGPAPVPVRLAVWVVGLALSVTVTVPVLCPLAVGLKLTLMLQEAPATTLEPQVLVWEKLPVTAMLVILRAAVPVFERVRV
jgi:hypothetical protein